MKFKDFQLLTEKKVFKFKAGHYVIVDPKLVMNHRDFAALSMELNNIQSNVLEYEYNGFVIAAFKLQARSGDYPSNYNNKEVEVSTGKLIVIPRDLIPDNKFEKESLADKAISTTCQNDFECSLQQDILKVGNLIINVSKKYSIPDMQADPNHTPEK